MKSLLALCAMVTMLPRQGGEMDRLRWLAGCWEARRGARTITEMWMAPDAGLMMGASRTVAGGQVRATEQLKLEFAGGRLAYVALPSGQAETRFEATDVSDSGFVVENPAHDFPKKIIYRRRGADSLVARIEGDGRGVDFPMRRISCGG